MKIKSKLLTGYLLVAISSVLVGYIGSMTTPQVAQAFDRLTTQTIPIIESIENIQFSGIRLVSSTSEYGFIKAEKAAAAANLFHQLPEEDEEKEEEEEIKLAKQQLNSAIEQYSFLITTYFPDKTEPLLNVKQSIYELIIKADNLIELKKQDITGVEILELKEKFELSEKIFLDNVSKILEQEHEELEKRSKHVHSAITTGNNILWVASGLAIILALFLGNAVSRAISIPIDRLKIAAKSVGEGELDTKINVNSQDEIGDLGLSFNKMTEALNDTQARLANTQSQLVQSAKLASVGEMATGVAHELNQPLGIIAMNSDLQIDEVRSGQYGETLQTFELILKQVERATAIIDHLRIFGRESNTLAKSPIALNKLIEDAFIMFKEQLRIRDINVVMNLGDNLPCVSCNQIQLEQVLTNLISNARDAMENTNIKQLTITTRQLDDKAIIDIEDTGYGITPTDIGKIFDPFFTTKEVGKGTGLGLSISYGIIEEHGGKLRVSSVEGQGSTFSIELGLS